MMTRSTADRWTRVVGAVDAIAAIIFSPWAARRLLSTPENSICDSKTLCDPGAASLGTIKIVKVARFAKAIRRALRRNVALGGAEQFVTYHEFLNRGAAEQRRKVVRVQMPFFVGAAVGGLLVESHRVWERRLEQIVITNRDAPQDVAEEIALFPAKLIDRSNMALAQHQRLEWPNRPERNDHGKSNVLADDPEVQLQLQLQVVAQQARMFLSAIIPERRQLSTRKVWQRSIRPNLAVRMRIARAHHLAAIFENLHVIDPRNLPKRDILLDPGIHDSAQLREAHSRNCEIVPRRKTHHAADSLL